MGPGVLPEDGADLAFTIGLHGPGRRHRSQARPVTWITDRAQVGAGTTWAGAVPAGAVLAGAVLAGARLLEVGSAIRLLVSRPPRTLEAALPIAAEQVAFSDQAHGGLYSAGEIARALAGNPFRDFWWD